MQHKGDKINMDVIAGHVADIKHFSGNKWKKIPLKRRWYIWVDDIRLDIKEIGYVGVDWIKLAQDRHK
jgi:hypothetical protein